MLQKACTGDEISLSRFEGSPAKASPLKKQMRLFEAPSSPEKRVADLSNPFASETQVVEKKNTFFGHRHLLKATNLLKSRKTCEKKHLNITDFASVDQKIISFGQYISGQTLGNRLQIANKTNKELTFSILVDSSEPLMAETAHDLLAPFQPEDLPFQTHKHDKSQAVNSQTKFKSWAIENPVSRTL